MMKTLGEFNSEEVVGSVGEDEGGQARVEPLGDDGSPVIDPGLDEFKLVAADEAEHRMPTGHGATVRWTRLAALSCNFSLGGGRRGEQGSAVEEDSVDVESAQEFVERAFGRPIVEVVAMTARRRDCVF